MSTKKNDDNTPENESIVRAPRARTKSIPPTVLVDDQPLETNETQTAKQWAANHPWLSHHRPVMTQVTAQGETHMSFSPLSWSGSPYGTWNGGVVKTGGIAAVQASANALFGAGATLLWAKSSFIKAATLDLPLRFHAKFEKYLSASRVQVDVTWYQQNAEGQRTDLGSITAALAKGRPETSLAAATEFDPEPDLRQDEGEDFTTESRHLVDTNPLFSHMDVQLSRVTQHGGAKAFLAPRPWMLNTRGLWSDGLQGAFGDAVVCYAAIPVVANPTTAQLEIQRIAPVPGNARLYGVAKPQTILRDGRVIVHGEVYYLTQSGEKEIAAVLYATIVGGK